MGAKTLGDHYDTDTSLEVPRVLQYDQLSMSALCRIGNDPPLVFNSTTSPTRF